MHRRRPRGLATNQTRRRGRSRIPCRNAFQDRSPCRRRDRRAQARSHSRRRTSRRSDSRSRSWNSALFGAYVAVSIRAKRLAPERGLRDPARTRADLPSGKVTFLFTDIEGSTRLLTELGDRYPTVLGEHQRAPRQAFGNPRRRRGGHARRRLFICFRARTGCAGGGRPGAALARRRVRPRSNRPAQACCSAPRVPTLTLKRPPITRSRLINCSESY